MQRQIRQQGKKKRIFALCDGKSEIEYLTLTTSAYNVDKRLVKIENRPFKNSEEMLAELEKLKPKKKSIKLAYEEIHLICDKEKLENKSRQTSYRKFTTEIKKLQKHFGTTTLKIITSFPTFEFFLLLHFPLKDGEFKKLHDNKELIKLLSSQYKSYSKGSRKWMEDAIFNKEFEKKINLALDRAERIKTSDSNSWTKIFETVRQIIDNSEPK